MSDNETLRVYADQAETYAKLVEESLSSDPLLHDFIGALPNGAAVLDLGCGPGQAAHQMADAGLDVTATDAVPEMIEMAKSHPKVTARVARFDDITEVAAYAGIWTNFSLLHAPRADMPRHLAALYKSLKPKGLLHIALKTGTGQKRDAVGRHYTYYEDAELTGLLEQAGFTVTSRTTGCDKGMDGTMADWIAMRAHA